MLEDTDIQKDAVERYTLKAYEENKINFFSVLTGMMDESSRNNWLEKVKKDGKNNYSYTLEEEDFSFDENFPDDDFFDSDFVDDDFMDDDFQIDWDHFLDIVFSCVRRKRFL